VRVIPFAVRFRAIPALPVLPPAHAGVPPAPAQFSHRRLMPCPSAHCHSPLLALVYRGSPPPPLPFYNCSPITAACLFCCVLLPWAGRTAACGLRSAQPTTCPHYPNLHLCCGLNVYHIRTAAAATHAHPHLFYDTRFSAASSPPPLAPHSPHTLRLPSRACYPARPTAHTHRPHPPPPRRHHTLPARHTLVPLPVPGTAVTGRRCLRATPPFASDMPGWTDGRRVLDGSLSMPFGTLAAFRTFAYACLARGRWFPSTCGDPAHHTAHRFAPCMTRFPGAFTLGGRTRTVRFCNTQHAPFCNNHHAPTPTMPYLPTHYHCGQRQAPPPALPHPTYHTRGSPPALPPPQVPDLPPAYLVPSDVWLDVS